MHHPRPRRSALYLPASNARAIDKVRTLPCDVVILDLEDAVAPDAKPEARRQATAALAAGGFGAREVVVRVNGLDTPWGADDLAAVGHAAAVLVPKVDSPADLMRYAATLPPATRLWAMIETPAALLALAALGQAAKASRTDVWVIGSNDLAKDLRLRVGPGREALLPHLAMAVAAARAWGLEILDGVFNDIADTEGLARQCVQGRDFGFDGKTLIHPDQIAAANLAFSPEPAATRWARRVAAAFELTENAGKGVIRLEGRMVERLHLDEARRLIALAEAISGREE